MSLWLGFLSSPDFLSVCRSAFPRRPKERKLKIKKLLFLKSPRILRRNKPEFWRETSWRNFRASAKRAFSSAKTLAKKLKSNTKETQKHSRLNLLQESILRLAKGRL